MIAGDGDGHGRRVAKPGCSTATRSSSTRRRSRKDPAELRAEVDRGADARRHRQQPRPGPAVEHAHRHVGVHRGPGHPPARARTCPTRGSTCSPTRGRRVHDDGAARREGRRRERLRQPDHVHARGPRHAGVRRRPRHRVADRRVRRRARRPDPDRARPPDHHRPREPGAGAEAAERPVHHAARCSRFDGGDAGAGRSRCSSRGPPPVRRCTFPKRTFRTFEIDDPGHERGPAASTSAG